MAGEAAEEAAVSAAAEELGQEARGVALGAEGELQVAPAGSQGRGVSLRRRDRPMSRHPKGGARCRTKGAAIVTQWCRP